MTEMIDLLPFNDIAMDMATKAVLFGAGLTCIKCRDLLTRRIPVRNLWQIRDVESLAIIAASVPVETGQYLKWATGIGQLRALGVLRESLSKGYHEIKSNQILLASDSVQRCIENDLILLGGVKNNKLSKEFMECLEDRIPVRQEGSTIFWRERHRQGWSDQEERFEGHTIKNVADNDYGLIIRARSPFTAQPRTVLLISGSHTFGVIAAAKFFVGTLQRHLGFLTLSRRNVCVLVKCEVVDDFPVNITPLKTYTWK